MTDNIPNPEKSPRVYLAAYTAPGADSPPFINVSYVDTMVEVTVRSVDGGIGSIRLNQCNFATLCREAAGNLPK